MTSPRADEEPPSSSGNLRPRLDASSRLAGAILPSPNTASRDGDDDEFAEWDSIETIDAVAHALAAYGDVVRLEANADFPERLRG